MKGSSISWSLLLVLLIVIHFIEPFVGTSWILEFAISSVLAFTLVCASLFTGLRTSTFVVICVFAALWMASNLLAGFNFDLRGVGVISSGSLMLMAVFVTFRYLLNAKNYDAELLFGAIFGYLLLAETWAFVYVNIERWSPGSFTHSLQALDWSTFQYFSLVTITTLGFGEITPANALTRNLVAFEAVMGVMYVAVLIGSIIGNYNLERRKDHGE
ncbi:MAG: ion channel [Rhizobiaceae bacterium]